MAKQAQLDEVRPALNKANKAASKVSKAVDVVEEVADKATDILEDGLEVVADVVPETLDAGVHIAAEGVRSGANALTSPKRLGVILGVSGLVLGAGVGVGAYFFLKKRLERKYLIEMEEKLTTEIDSMHAFYQRRTKSGKFESPEAAAKELGVEVDEVAEAAADAVEEYGADQLPGVVPENQDPREGSNSRRRYDKIAQRSKEFVEKAAETVQDTAEAVVEVAEESLPEKPANVFDNSRRIDGWDQEAEEENRNPAFPYIISHDEYMENTYEHEQNALTYYAGDDILADEREVAIDDVEGLVGTENLTMFGHGSRDSSVVYIRNEVREIDFDITLRPGKYVEEVVGLSEVEDSTLPRVRRGRG